MTFGDVLLGRDRVGWPNNFQDDYNHNEYLNSPEAEMELEKETLDMHVNRLGHMFVLDRPEFLLATAKAGERCAEILAGILCRVTSSPYPIALS